MLASIGVDLPTAILLVLALGLALGFEFVNGFHDTANAVATVIYTHSLEPHVAVVWSGIVGDSGTLKSPAVSAPNCAPERDAICAPVRLATWPVVSFAMVFEFRPLI